MLTKLNYLLTKLCRASIAALMLVVVGFTSTPVVQATTSPCPNDVQITSGPNYTYSSGQTQVAMMTFYICIPGEYQYARTNWIGTSVDRRIDSLVELQSLSAPTNQWLYRAQYLPSAYTGTYAMYTWLRGMPTTASLNIPLDQWYPITVYGQVATTVPSLQKGNVCLKNINFRSAKGTVSLASSSGTLPNICNAVYVSP